MTQQLLTALRDGKYWIDRFTRFSYREAFAEYRGLYLPLYTAAVEQFPPQELADQLLDALEEAWKKDRPWNRAAARVNTKMVLVAYLTPMLLSAGSDPCAVFAQTLCDAWNARRPKDGYETADYDSLLGGFRNSIMGIDFESKHYDKK